MEMTVYAHPKDVLRFLNLQAATSVIAFVSIVINMFVLHAVLRYLMNYKSVNAAIYAATKHCKFTLGRKPEWETDQ